VFSVSFTLRPKKRELNNAYSSPDIVTMMKLKRAKWAGHVACVKNLKYGINLLEVLNVGDHLDVLRRKCGNYIKTTLAVREVVWESAD
jgi:hypothetical protein